MTWGCVQWKVACCSLDIIIASGSQVRVDLQPGHKADRFVAGRSC